LYFTPRFNNVVKLPQVVKAIDERIKVVVVGMHVSCCPQEVLDCETIDFVIIGEGELTFLRLLEALNTDWNGLSSIKGIGFRNIENDKIINYEVNLIDNLDKIPFPAWDLLPMEEYFRVNVGRDALTKERRHISIITSRGCPYDCSFCSSAAFWKKTWRKRSAENVLEEIKYLVEKYQIREISFEDDNLSLDPIRLAKICLGIIKRGFNIKWNTPNGISVKNLDRDLIRLMKKSGCERLNFGIESGDEYVLHNVIKKISLEKVKEIICCCKDEGITTLGYFVIGMPGETLDSIERSIEFAKKLDLDEIAFLLLFLSPGTELYRVCKDKGYLKYEYKEILAEDEIENRILFETPLISADTLSKYRSRFYSDFYRARCMKRPFYYLKRCMKDPLVIIRYVKELFNR